MICRRKRWICNLLTRRTDPIPNGITARGRICPTIARFWPRQYREKEKPLELDAAAQKHSCDVCAASLKSCVPAAKCCARSADGTDLDLDAVVRSRCDLAAGGQGSDRVHLMSRPQANDLAVTLLVDVSLSTDAWVDNRRVLDVERRRFWFWQNGIAACGDRCSILTFYFPPPFMGAVETVKDFDESFRPTVEHRIATLKPGFMPVWALPCGTQRQKLAEQPNRKKLLLLLTDGKAQ